MYILEFLPKAAAVCTAGAFFFSCSTFSSHDKQKAVLRKTKKAAAGNFHKLSCCSLSILYYYLFFLFFFPESANLIKDFCFCRSCIVLVYFYFLMAFILAVVLDAGILETVLCTLIREHAVVVACVDRSSVG